MFDGHFTPDGHVVHPLPLSFPELLAMLAPLVDGVVGFATVTSSRVLLVDVAGLPTTSTVAVSLLTSASATQPAASIVVDPTAFTVCYNCIFHDERVHGSHDVLKDIRLRIFLMSWPGVIHPLLLRPYFP